MGNDRGGCLESWGIAALILLVGLALATVSGWGNSGVYRGERQLTWDGWSGSTHEAAPDAAPELPPAAPAPLPTEAPLPTPQPLPTARAVAALVLPPEPVEVAEFVEEPDLPAAVPLSVPWGDVAGGLVLLAGVVVAVVRATRQGHRPIVHDYRAPGPRPAPAAEAPTPQEPEPEPAPRDQAELDHLTDLLVSGLDRLGMAHKNQDGTRQHVVLRKRQLAEQGNVLLLEVDTERLPHGVNARKLTDEKTTHHLTAVLHRPVLKLNTTGVTYAVLLNQQAGIRPKLPKAVDLNEALRSWPGTAYTFPLGESLSGPVWEPLRGHYLVGGETGSGKTTWLLSTVYALAASNPPESLQIVIVDPKNADLTILEGLSHVPFAVATEVESAGKLLAWLVGEIERRLQVIAEARLALGLHLPDLEAYNARAGGKLPRILAVIDEVTDLVDLAGGQKSDLYRALQRIVQIGRSAGVHAIIGTQNPRFDVLGTLVKGNLAGRISFRVTTWEHSRVILGVPGAEELPRIPGRFLARLGDGKLHELQGYYLPAADLDMLARLSAIGDTDGPSIELSDADRTLLIYAAEQLAGEFPRAGICAGCNIGWTAYEAAKERLSALGYLVKGKRGRWELSEKALASLHPCSEALG